MKNGYIYTVIFMIIISAFFSGTLAVANELAAEKIETNRIYLEKKVLLDLFEIDYEDSAESVSSKFSENITEINSDKYRMFALGKDDAVIAYAIYFTDVALWGTIAGYIAVSAELDTLLGIEFTEQNETPGLGGRIEEKWFKDQFRGVAVNFSTVLEFGDSIDAITGATSSSNAVLKTVNSFISKDLPELEALK